MLKVATWSLALCAVLTACPLPVDWDERLDDVPDLPPPCSNGSCEEETPSCLFGDSFRELYQNEAFELTPDEWITDEAQLGTELERAQLVAAVQQSSHSDVTTVAEALARVDEHEVRRVWFKERTSGRAFVVYEYGAGDNSYGAYFVRGELPVVAQIHDGDLLACTTH